MNAPAIAPGQRRWLSLPEVAETLGLSIHTLRKIRARGEGPPGVMMGRQLRFHLDDLAAWEAEQRKAADATDSRHLTPRSHGEHSRRSRPRAGNRHGPAGGPGASAA